MVWNVCKKCFKLLQYVTNTYNVCNPQMGCVVCVDESKNDIIQKSHIVLYNQIFNGMLVCGIVLVIQYVTNIYNI